MTKLLSTHKSKTGHVRGYVRHVPKKKKKKSFLV